MAAPIQAGRIRCSSAYFIIATLLNFVPVLLAEPVQIEVTVVGVAHVLAIARILVARHAASGQRAKDLERFQSLKQTTTEDQR